MKKGVYQLSNGYWAFRCVVNNGDKKKDIKRVKDELGNPLKTKRQAVAARNALLLKIAAESEPMDIMVKTLSDVFNEYCEKGRAGKAYSTIRKQDSLWNNHLRDKFGSRRIDDISVAEINDYLSDLYCVEGRAYSYVESFLKMFYLIFGQAYSRNYISTETYNKLCVNKDVRIRMPKMKTNEETDIVSFSKEEIAKLDGYFKGKNAETAYMLGKHCGLRINECYGLKWSNIDLKSGTILIDRQMQYQDGLIKLVSLKTRNARRTVYMSDKLRQYLTELKAQTDEAEKTWLYKERRMKRLLPI